MEKEKRNGRLIDILCKLDTDFVLINFTSIFSAETNHIAKLIYLDEYILILIYLNILRCINLFNQVQIDW